VTEATRSTHDARPGISGHLEICRIDHWAKHVFVLPGIVVAVAIDPSALGADLWLRALVGVLALGLVSSSNYVLNEVRDAASDAHHPEKSQRPVPAGRVNVPLAYAQWIGLGIVGVALGAWINRPFALVLVFFWLMACAYNLRPLRTKDVPYLDVLSEGLNNPIRMLAGWYLVDPPAIAPASLLLSYWMIGCYFMAMKRLAELRHIADPEAAAAYRRSFAHYDETRLLISVLFYAATSMLLLGAFIVRYRLELILSFPFVAWTMALYMKLGLADDSPVQHPERLHRERALLVAVLVCATVMTLCMFVDLPFLARLFAPTAPTNEPYP
jgi:decaprenyl-phosphate phosphoribosyltransferase